MSLRFETTWIGQHGCTVFAKKIAAILATSFQARQPTSIVIRLDGTLGAGKTYFTQQLARELGASDGEVTSPTFVIVQSYDTQPPINHLDLYRVNDDDELLELGFEELLEQPAIMLVEWGGKFTHLFTIDHLSITIEVLNENDRMVTLQSFGPDSNAILQQVQG